MKPVKTLNQLSKDCNPISSNCVRWEGPDIPCIELCAGDTITHVNFKLATLVCEIQEELDLTELPLYCLDDTCTGCTLCSPEDKTLKNILDCIIKKYCELETAIENIDTGGGTVTIPGIDVTIDCVENITGTILSTDPTNDEIIQLIIDGVCKNDEIITNILTTIVTIQNDCCGGGGGGVPLSDVTYTNCNSVIVTESIGTIIQSLKTEQCDLREDVGLEADVDTALAKQCDNITTNAVLGLSFTQAINLAESEGTQWDIMCALLSKVQEIETLQKECCQPDCSDIVMQVLGTLQDDGSGTKTFDFTFTFDGSTTVPFSGTDCGSVITLKDVGGNTQVINNVLLDDDLTWTGVPVNPILDLTDDIKISVQSCLEFAEYNLKCVNCIEGVVAVTNNCEYCTITINGTDIDLNISYLNAGIVTTINVSTTGTENKQVIIPGTAVIQALVLNSGTINLITNDPECPGILIEIADVKALKCYQVNIDADFYNITGTTVLYNIVGIWNAGVQEVTISSVRSDLTTTRAVVGTASPDPIKLWVDPGVNNYNGGDTAGTVFCDSIYLFNDDGSAPNLSNSKTTITDDITASGSLIVTGLEQLYFTDEIGTEELVANKNNFSTVVIKAVEGLDQLYLELAMNVTVNDLNAVKPKVMLSFTEIVDCDICT